MKTFLGNEIQENTLGILYLCEYNYKDNTMKVGTVIEFEESFQALQAYATIRVPESQLAIGQTREKFEHELESLHNKLNDPKWVKRLAEYL